MLSCKPHAAMRCVDIVFNHDGEFSTKVRYITIKLLYMLSSYRPHLRPARPTRRIARLINRTFHGLKRRRGGVVLESA